MEFSKRLISDIRALLWAVTLGGLALAAYCIREGYIGSLPWLSAMVGLPWTAHGRHIPLHRQDHVVGPGVVDGNPSLAVEIIGVFRQVGIYLSCFRTAGQRA